MAIKRVSDLEQFKYDGSSGIALSAFLTSPEYLYSCLEVSHNTNGEEHSQFESMRIDIQDLAEYFDYNIINNDIVFQGNKSFTNNVIMKNGADVSGSFHVYDNGSSNIGLCANDYIQLNALGQSSNANTGYISLSAKNYIKLDSKQNIQIDTAKALSLSAHDNINLQTSNGNAKITSNKYITLDTAKTSGNPSTGTVLSGAAEKIIFNVTNAGVNGKFQLTTGAAADNVILSVDANNIVYFKHDIKGTAFQARWADLAEYYIADKEYEPGTLVKFGGKYEITEANTEANAVVTTKPGFILNRNISQNSYNEHPVAIALVGRTPVKVLGKVQKFQNIVMSNTPGVAMAQTDPTQRVLGKALEANESDYIKVILCAVQLSF